MYRSTAWSPTTAIAWQKVPVDATCRFRLPQAGWRRCRAVGSTFLTAGTYQVDANALFGVSGTGTYTTVGVGVYKNGVQLCQNYAVPAVQSWVSPTVSDKVQCAAGDYLELFVINSQGTAMNITSADNYFAVALITAGPGPQGPQGPPGPGGAAYSVQRKLGSASGYVAVTLGAVLDGGKMTLSITPTIPVWWEVAGFAGLVIENGCGVRNCACGQKFHMVSC